MTGHVGAVTRPTLPELADLARRADACVTHHNACPCIEHAIAVELRRLRVIVGAVAAGDFGASLQAQARQVLRHPVYDCDRETP